MTRNSSAHLVEVEARRRLVEHQHPDVGRDRPRDRHQLLDGERVPAQDRGGVDVEPEVGEHGVRVARASVAQSIIPNRRGSRPSAMFSATEMFGQQVDLLVDRADPALLGVVRRSEAHHGRRPAAARPSTAGALR